jgi:hypothetical protein
MLICGTKFEGRRNNAKLCCSRSVGRSWLVNAYCPLLCLKHKQGPLLLSCSTAFQCRSFRC